VVYLVRARCDFLTEFSFGGVPDDEYEFVRSPPTQKKRKKNRTANKDIACLLLVSSLDAKVTTEVRAADFTERCCFKLSVLETDAFADM